MEESLNSRLKDNRWKSSSVFVLDRAHVSENNSRKWWSRAAPTKSAQCPTSSAPFASAMKRGVVDFRSRSSRIDDGKNVLRGKVRSIILMH